MSVLYAIACVEKGTIYLNLTLFKDKLHYCMFQRIENKKALSNEWIFSCIYQVGFEKRIYQLDNRKIFVIYYKTDAWLGKPTTIYNLEFFV